MSEEDKPQPLTYAPAERWSPLARGMRPRHTPGQVPAGEVIQEIIAGVFGYLCFALGSALLARKFTQGWLALPPTILPPLVLMLLLARVGRLRIMAWFTWVGVLLAILLFALAVNSAK